MDHAVEARIQGNSAAGGKIGLQLSMAVSIVVPTSVGFGAPPPPREMKVDGSKVIVTRKG